MQQTNEYLSWPLGGPPRMGAASAAYCALSAGSKPIEEVPKVIPAWQVGVFCGSLPNTALLNTPKIFFLTSPCQGSDLSSLGRLIMKKQSLMAVVSR